MSEIENVTPIAIELDDKIEEKDTSSVKSSPSNLQDTDESSKRKSEYLCLKYIKLERLVMMI